MGELRDGRTTGPHPSRGATWGQIRSSSSALRSIESWLVLIILGLVGLGLLVTGIRDGRWAQVVSGMLFLAAGVLAVRAAGAFRRRTEAIAAVDEPSFLVNRPRHYLPEIGALLGAIGAVVSAIVLMALTT